MSRFWRAANVLGLGMCGRQGRWWPTAVLVLMVAAGCWLATAEGKYTAWATLRVAAEPNPTGSPTVTDRDRFEIYRNTQQQFLLNRFVLLAALRKPEVAELPSVKANEGGDPARWLQHRLHVSFPGKAEIMEVSLSSDDPQEAATLVNAVVDAYFEAVVNAELDQKQRRLNELDKAIAIKEAELRQKMKAADAEKLGNATVDVEMLRADIKNLQTVLSAIAVERDRLSVEMRRTSRVTLLLRAEVPERPHFSFW